MIFKDLKYYQELMINLAMELDSIKEDIIASKHADEIYGLQKELEICMSIYEDSCQAAMKLITMTRVVDLQAYQQVKQMKKIHGI